MYLAIFSSTVLPEKCESLLLGRCESLLHGERDSFLSGELDDFLLGKRESLLLGECDALLPGVCYYSVEHYFRVECCYSYDEKQTSRKDPYPWAFSHRCVLYEPS